MPRVLLTRRVRRSLLIASALLAVCAPVSEARPTSGPARFDVLQVNLCRNDDTGCRSTGDPVASAIDAMRRHQPDLVTLNEVCAHDITAILRQTSYQGEYTPVRDASGGPVRCADGRGDYGIAVLAHPDQGAPGENVVERPFAAQDGGQQRRVLLCAPFSGFSACTTDLSPREDTARRQCGELADVASGYGERTVVGGDYRLQGPDVSGCVPRGWLRADDGAGQHVLATNFYQLGDSQNLPVPGTARPGLLVGLDS